MPVPLQFGEWRPDLALIDNQFAADVDNVFPAANSYKPIPSLQPFTGGTLPGLISVTAARKTTGEWAIYGGTTTKLYQFVFFTGWTDISRTVGGPYNVPAGEVWSFAPFGKYLYAVATGNAMQRIDVDGGGNAIDAPGSPPMAHNVKQLGDFLVLGGLDSNRRKLRWCSIDDPSAWVPGINLCDEQEFPDGGPVQGVTGDTIGFVLQDRAIRSMQFLPSDTAFVFNFSRILTDKGSVSEFGFISVGGIAYFLAEDGFYAINPQGQLSPIGQDKVNEWFLANSDIGRRNLVQCFAANKPYIVWPYHSNSATPLYDKIIIYDWSQQKWGKGSFSAFIWAMMATISLDLDTTGSEAGDALLDSTAMSLDSFAYVGGRPIACAVDASGTLASLTGPPMPATLETAEVHLVPGQRAYVSEVYPLIDGAVNALVTAGTRERLQDDVVWGNPTPLEITGSASLLSSSRLHRFRVQTLGGEPWTHAEGVQVEAQPDGEA